MTSGRLEQADSYLQAFSARVLEHGSFGGAPSVLLDVSAFYPESGGQLADHGSIGTAKVIDVQLDELGRVHHLYTGEPPEVDAVVEASIDWPRRREHMALHTGQHVLSKALLDLAQAPTVSSRLGSSECTVDVARADLGPALLAEVEELVNLVVDENRPMRAWYPTEEELGQLALRRAPKRRDALRVVSVEGFDHTPCGGTHVSSTAEIGCIWLTGSERYKGGTRVYFSAGPRARRELFARSALVNQLAAQLGTAAPELAQGVARLERTLKDARAELGLVRAALADNLAAGVEWQGCRAVVELEAELEVARRVVERLVSRADAEVFLTVTVPGGVQLIVARGSASPLHAGEALKRLLAAAGGKGGGRPERAEGRLAKPVALAELIRETL